MPMWIRPAGLAVIRRSCRQRVQRMRDGHGPPARADSRNRKDRAARGMPEAGPRSVPRSTLRRRSKDRAARGMPEAGPRSAPRSTLRRRSKDRAARGMPEAGAHCLGTPPRDARDRDGLTGSEPAQKLVRKPKYTARSISTGPASGCDGSLAFWTPIENSVPGRGRHARRMSTRTYESTSKTGNRST